jgi:hypothetical protein
MPSPRIDSWLRRLALALAILASLYALVLVDRRAGQGRQALLRWKPDFERLDAGLPLYHRLDPARADLEGFPTPPVTALALDALLDASSTVGLGDRAACLALALLKLGCAWLVGLAALRLAFGRARDAPGLAALLVFCGCLRIDLSELAHGNINLLVGGCVAASLLAWQRGRDGAAGAWAACGAALKLTPALFLVYFAWKRSARGVIGFALAYAVLSWLVPGLALGFERNWHLYVAWCDQMLGPALEGAPLALTQTEQINQALTGILARWCSDAVAIAARPPVHAADVRIALVELSPLALRRVILGASLAVVAVLAWACRTSESRGERTDAAATDRPAHAATDSQGAPRRARDRWRALGEYALVALAMLLLSERSWKQHFVLLPLAHAALLALALAPATTQRWRRAAWGALAASLLLHAGSADALLGARGSDYAEALGAFGLGALALYAVLALHVGRGVNAAIPYAAAAGRRPAGG